MIERLQIENFQKHELYRVKFDPRITMFVGATDAGKSSILRALRWVCINRPDGEAHIRWGVKKCRVRVRIDGRDITRTRGPATNTYHLDKDPFRAFGTGVPDEVAAVAQLTEHNFGGQHDPAFLFHETPTMVVKALNAVVDLDIIDDVLGNLNTQLHRAKTTHDVTTARRDAIAKDLEDTEWVENANAALEGVEGAAGTVAHLRNRAGRLATLRAAATQHATVQAAAEGMAQAARSVVANWNRCAELRIRITRLLQAALTAKQHRDVPAAPDIRILTSLYKEWNEVWVKHTNLKRAIDAAGAAWVYMDEAENHAATEAAALKREFPLCPTCGKPI